MTFSPLPSLQPLKPKLRGVLHQYAFFISLSCGIALIVLAPDTKARLAASIYAFSVSGLLGTSALYHRVNWKPKARRWMKRLDHSMIFVLIAGTYTPLALLALHGALAKTVLVMLWAGVVLGVIFKFACPDSPKWLPASVSPKRLTAAIYVIFGLLTAITFGELPSAVGWLGISGLAVGGLLYIIGAFVYARERPNPVPKVFGYHEVFHTLVVVAAALQYAVITSVVLVN